MACGGTQSLSRVWLFVTLWTVARQAPLSMGFPRQQYWSELPFPSQGDLPNSKIKPESSALAGRLFITTPPGKPYIPSYTQGIPKVRGKIYHNQQGRHHLTIDSWKGSNFSPACLSKGEIFLKAKGKKAQKCISFFNPTIFLEGKTGNISRWPKILISKDIWKEFCSINNKQTKTGTPVTSAQFSGFS